MNFGDKIKTFSKKLSGIKAGGTQYYEKSLLSLNKLTDKYKLIKIMFGTGILINIYLIYQKLAVYIQLNMVNDKI